MSVAITGTAVSPSGAIKPSSRIVLRRAVLDVVAQGGNFVIPDDISVKTNSLGEVSFSILPGKYVARVSAIGNDGAEFAFNVPDVVSADFADCIGAAWVPIPPDSVDAAQTARDEAVAAAVDAESSALASLESAEAAANPLWYSVADPSDFWAMPELLPVGLRLDAQTGEQWEIVAAVDADFIHPLSTYGVKTVARNGVISTSQFPCVADDATDARVWLNVALQTSQRRGLRLFVAGKYRVVSHVTLGALLVLPGYALNIFGSGPRESGFRLDDSAANADLLRRTVFGTTEPEKLTNVTLDGIYFEGSLGVGGSYSQRRHLADLCFSGDLRVNNCGFFKSRNHSLVGYGGDRAYVYGCIFEDGYRDGVHITDTLHVSVIGNHFYRMLDDSIALHYDNVNMPSPVDVAHVVTGNILTDSQGICCLGAKRTVISGNTLVRPAGRGIAVGHESSWYEGDSSSHSITITGNVICDIFSAYLFSNLSGGLRDGISVYSLGPTAVEGSYVGYPDTSGVIADPYGLMDLHSYGSSTVRVLGGYYIVISGNTITRTLPSGVSYSSYGYGQRLSRSGYVDPVVSAGDLCQNGIKVDGGIVGMSIQGNIISGFETAVNFDKRSGPEIPVWRDVNISGNVMRDFSAQGISVSGLGELSITSNEIDGDPYHKLGSRAPNGGWHGSSGLYAVRSGGATALVSGNRFKNVSQAVDPDGTKAKVSGNQFFGKPFAIGYNYSNLGVGFVHREDDGSGTNIITDWSPSSPSTYAQLLNHQVDGAAAMPSTGIYVAGKMVRNTAPTVASGRVLMGWLRLTTGSNHVSGTDWTPVYQMTTAS